MRRHQVYDVSELRAPVLKEKFFEAKTATDSAEEK